MSKEFTATNTLQPVSTTERIFALDVLRGFAILGVLVAYALWSLGGPDSETYGTADVAIEFVLGIMVDTKAYTLLAFLFGLGFAIQMTRAEGRGESVIPIYCRRLLALMCIGVAHALLLRDGDILVPYATMGFVLLLFRNASNRVLLLGIVVGSVFHYAVHSLWQYSGIPYPPRPNTVGMGHFASTFAWTTYWYTTAITHWPGALPMFLAGLYVGKRRLMEDLGEHRRGLLQILVAGLCVGAAAYICRSAMIGMTDYHPHAASLADIAINLLWAIHAWGVAAFYAAIVLLLLQRPGFQKFSAPFADVGRMSLTNYLLQAVLIVPICITFGLFDKVTPAVGLLLSALVALIQIPLSVVWLRHFRFGPAEWLWRSITYWKPQPMRLTVSSPPLSNAILSTAE
jgi:uncharacterized protein